MSNSVPKPYTPMFLEYLVEHGITRDADRNTTEFSASLPHTGYTTVLVVRQSFIGRGPGWRLEGAPQVVQWEEQQKVRRNRTVAERAAAKILVDAKRTQESPRTPEALLGLR